MKIFKKEHEAAITFLDEDSITLTHMMRNTELQEIMNDLTIENIVINFLGRKDIDVFVIGFLIKLKEIQQSKGGNLYLINFKDTNLFQRTKDLNLNFDVMD